MYSANAFADACPQRHGLPGRSDERTHEVTLGLGVITLLVALATSGFAAEVPKSISASEAASHLGQTQTVCGVVASSKFAKDSNRSPTFLNLDRPYPNQVFTAVIWGTDRSKFKEAPEIAFQGKHICVRGPIQVYKEKPEVIVTDPSQIHQEDVGK
jgi:DNA/RNA endonuclease YhcR with UshA esterase domain